MTQTVKLGDRVRWTSAAGVLRGEVISMCLAKNGADVLVPWIDLEFIRENRTQVARLCATEGNLKMMQFKVTFRG